MKVSRRMCAAVVTLALLLPSALTSVPAGAEPMRTAGRRLLDACSNEFVVRGVEQILGEQLPPGNDWLGLVEKIAASGVNAVRILPHVTTLSVADVDEMLTFVGTRDMVAYLGTLSDDGSWFGRSDVRSMLARHESYLIIDAYGEPQYDDRPRFLSEAVRALRQYRAWGYRVPLTVTGNQFGRDLPSVLSMGAEITAADPLNNTIMGWQAYWGSSGFYQSHYGMSLSEAIAAIAEAPFPIQLGLDHVTDPPSETMDFGAMMSMAEARGIGWLWWDWYNPYGRDNNLSRDGSADALTATGRIVVDSHGASIANTSRLSCTSPEPPTVPPSVRLVSIDAGGAAADGFGADQSFYGGRVAPRSSARIDRSLIPSPAPPEASYQTERWGSMTYRVRGFQPYSAHQVELHFAETYFDAPGERRFNVTINDARVLSEYDIVAEAGAANKAVVEEFSTTANHAGDIVIRFGRGSMDQAKISAIAIR